MAERLHYLISLSTLTIPGFCENDSILSGETKDQPLFPGRVAPLPRRHEAPQHAGGARPGPPRVPPPRAGTNLSGPRWAGRVSGGRSARRGGSTAPHGIRSGPLRRPSPPPRRPSRGFGLRHRGEFPGLGAAPAASEEVNKRRCRSPPTGGRRSRKERGGPAA